MHGGESHWLSHWLSCIFFPSCFGWLLLLPMVEFQSCAAAKNNWKIVPTALPKLVGQCRQLYSDLENDIVMKSISQVFRFGTPFRKEVVITPVAVESDHTNRAQ
jgi:hypothetical protein